MSSLRFGSKIEFIGEGVTVFEGTLYVILTDPPPINIPKEWILTKDNAIEEFPEMALGDPENEAEELQPQWMYVRASLTLDFEEEHSSGMAHNLQTWLTFYDYIFSIEDSPQLIRAFVYLGAF